MSIREPAFPAVGKKFYATGMSLRDYFAGQALTGLFTDGDVYISETIAKEIAAQCYTMADAMCAEREKEV